MRGADNRSMNAEDSAPSGNPDSNRARQENLSRNRKGKGDDQSRNARPARNGTSSGVQVFLKLDLEVELHLTSRIVGDIVLGIN